MAVLPSGLETIPLGTQGWNDIVTSNMQLLDTKLVNVMTGNKVLGNATVADITEADAQNPAAQTSASPTINTVSGTGDDTTINNNFTNLKTEFDKVINEIADLISKLTGNVTVTNSGKAKVNALLAELRKSSGNGVLGG